MIDTIICTICEGRYAYGLASLINSCLSNNFTGDFHVAIKEELPFWINQFRKIDSNTYEINSSSSITFHKTNFPYHLCYFKPFFIRDLLAQNENFNIFYFDPDITILNDWQFFEDWLAIGVPLCVDEVYPVIYKKNPWVMEWQNTFTFKIEGNDNELLPYINSGFIGVNSNHIELVNCWCNFTEILALKNHSLINFGPTILKYKQSRSNAFCSDQDVLNASLLACKKISYSIIGKEAMGFSAGIYIMLHNTGFKTWNKNFIKMLILKNQRITLADESYLRNSNTVIKTYSIFKLRLLKLNMIITKVLQRIL